MAGNKEIFQKAMNQGHSAAWDQDWEKAASFYKYALKEIPNHPQALSSLGLALFEMQNYPGSLDCYLKAAHISPDDAIPQEKIARIYERMGKLNEAVSSSMQAAELHLKARSVDKAIDNWQRVLGYQPDNLTVRFRLAAVYEKMGRQDDATTEYIASASILQRSGDVSRAAKALEAALKAMPDNQELRLAMSLLRSNQPLPRPSRQRGGSSSDVITNLREVDNVSESSEEDLPDPVTEARKKALVQLAGLLFDQADESVSNQPRGRGLRALSKGTAESGNDSSEGNRIVLHLGQAIESHTNGDFQQVVVEMEHALQLGFRHPAAYFLLGLLLKESNADKAGKYLQQSVKHPEYSLPSHLLLAQVYESLEQWNRAAASYLQALGLADSQLVEPAQADDLLAQYDAIIESHASNQDKAVLQATCRAISNQLMRPNWRSILKQARLNITASPAGLPPSPVSDLVLEARNTKVIETMAHVRHLAEAGILRSASEEAMFALQYAPSYLPLHELIGDLLLQDNRTGEAVQKYIVVSELYIVRGEANRAIRLLKRVSQIMPTDTGVRQRLIEILTAQDKIDDALKEYASLADLYYNMADLDKARHTYLEALKIAQKSSESRSWGMNLLLKVADIDMQRLNLRQALRIFDQIRTIQPDHAATRQHIVGLNFRLGQDAAAMKECDEYVNFLENSSRRGQAVEFLSDLLVDHSSRPDLRRRLAGLYINSKDINQAVIQLDAAADIFMSENKHMEAVNILETIVSLNPPNVQEYRTALESLRRGMLRK